MVETGEVLIHTVRELARNTAAIVDELVEAGRPVVVTKQGSPVVVIQPLPRDVERLPIGNASPGLLAPPPTVVPGCVVDVLSAEGALAQAATHLEPATSGGRWPGRSVTMTRLNQDTSGVIGEVQALQETRLITSRGRLVASLVPLPADIVARVLQLPQVQELLGAHGAWPAVELGSPSS